MPGRRPSRACRRGRAELAQQAVFLVGNTGGEHERLFVAEGGVPELQRPKAFDLDRVAVGVHELAFFCAGRRVIRVDHAVAEVADEQIAAEGPEARGRDHKAPRRVQFPFGDQALDQVTVGFVDVDEAGARVPVWRFSRSGPCRSHRSVPSFLFRPCRVRRACRPLAAPCRISRPCTPCPGPHAVPAGSGLPPLGVCDVQIAVQLLDIEGCEPGRDRRILESARHRCPFELFVEYVDPPLAEVGREQERLFSGRPDREARVVSPPVLELDLGGGPGDGAAPGGDRSRLRIEQEVRRSAPGFRCGPRTLWSR